MRINGGIIDLLASKKGFDMKTLSEKSGISRQNLSTIKKRGSCRTTTALKLSESLDVTVEELCIYSSNQKATWNSYAVNLIGGSENDETNV